MLVGGVIFIVLSFVGARYKDKEYKNIQFLQDFISGSILIAFTGVIVPDLFPVMELPSSLPTFRGSTVEYAPRLGVYDQSIINTVKDGNMKYYRKQDGGVTTVINGCPCTPLSGNDAVLGTN